MILINSEEKDRSTSDVIKWLLYHDRDFVRINKEDRIHTIHLSIGNDTKGYLTNNKGAEVSLDEISAYWYRRGELNFEDFVLEKKEADDLGLNAKNRRTLDLALNYNLEVTNLFFHGALESKKSFGRYSQRAVNKLGMLEYAKKCGFIIPETIVTSEKKELIKFLDKHDGNIICKPSWEISYIFTNDESLITFTHLFDKAILPKLDEHFYPTLFQECITKKYELRVFFFRDKIYPCAIFAQFNPETQTDYRTHSETKYRVVPFNLPKDLEEKVKKMIHYTNLNTGSFDFIVGENGTYYFVEVNPVGQFGFVSYPCNYKIEKDIAHFLMNENNAE